MKEVALLYSKLSQIEDLFTSAISKSVDAELRQVLGQQSKPMCDVLYRLFPESDLLNEP